MYGVVGILGNANMIPFCQDEIEKCHYPGNKNRQIFWEGKWRGEGAITS